MLDPVTVLLKARAVNADMSALRTLSLVERSDLVNLKNREFGRVSAVR